MNSYDMIFSINGIQNTPICNGILNEAWQVGVQWIVTKVTRI